MLREFGQYLDLERNLDVLFVGVTNFDHFDGNCLVAEPAEVAFVNLPIRTRSNNLQPRNT